MIAKLTKAKRAQLEKLFGEFAAAKEALAEALDEIASQWEEDISDRSERWLESEAGSAAQERTETMRALFDELSEADEPDWAREPTI